MQMLYKLERIKLMYMILFSSCSGSYPQHRLLAFLDNLLSLEAASGTATHFKRVVGFLPLGEWEPFLFLLPDQCFAAFMSVINGYLLVLIIRCITYSLLLVVIIVGVRMLIQCLLMLFLSLIFLHSL